MSDNELISIGEINSVFGVKGWVKIFSLTEPRENILGYSPWTIKKGSETKILALSDGRRQGKSVVACIEGVSDRDEAASYIGWEILIHKDQLPAPAKDEYYWADLVGLHVDTVLGVSLGVVDHLIETGANDVLVIKKHDEERLVPFLQEQVIKSIDLDKQIMIVDWDPDF
ncbi:MAG: ribosome maturation factor RimM [Methylococcales bacterium]|nr:ribosome maturation factor RimM [Methylococcales bacterium]